MDDVHCGALILQIIVAWNDVKSGRVRRGGGGQRTRFWATWPHKTNNNVLGDRTMPKISFGLTTRFLQVTENVHADVEDSSRVSI